MHSAKHTAPPSLRARAAALALIATVGSTYGCSGSHQGSVDDLQGPGALRSRVVVGLRDLSVVTFEGPQRQGSILIGRVLSCDGESCARVRRDGYVRVDETSSVSVIDSGRGRSTAIALGVIGGVVVLGTVLALSNFSLGSGSMMGGPDATSCPQVMSFDGRGWVLDSGTYSGALFPAAQRTDHDVLDHLVPVDNQYRLRMTNVMAEVEHTDALRLRLVDHAPGARVVPALDGALLTFTAPQAAVRAVDLRGRDVTADVVARDERLWRSHLGARDPDRADDLRDGVVLDFARPTGAQRARLWMRGTTTPWAERMLQDTLARLGPAVEGFYARLERDPSAREAVTRAMIREGMLLVSVWDGTRWLPRGYFWESGPELLKDQAMELALDDVPGDRVRVRLDAPVGFWVLDSAAVDFDQPSPLEVREVTPRTARHASSGAELTATLSDIDGRVHTAEHGDVVDLTFDAPPVPEGRARTVVLASTGWYRPQVAPSPEADPAAVERMLAEPGVLSRRSLAQLQRTILAEVLR